MKRVLCVALAALLLVSFMVVPALAAEPAFFDFEFVDVSSTFSVDLDAGLNWAAGDRFKFASDYLIPEGSYNVQLIFERENQTFDLGDFVISYSVSSINDVFVHEWSSEKFTSPLLGDSSFYIYASRNENFTVQGSDVYLSFSDYPDDFDVSGSFLRFTSIDSPSSPSISAGIISTAVSPELLSGILDELISLLPLILPVMVGCIGIRKAINWLIQVFKNT